MRILNKLWIFFWANYIFPDSMSAVTISCPPSKEYKPYTLNCSTNNRDVEWKSNTSGNIYATCNPVCRPTQPDITSATWNSTVSTFTILNMLRSGPFYLQEIACFHPASGGFPPTFSSTCKLEYVYVRPEKPTCGNPSLSDTSVSLTCQTQEILPTAGCVFYDKTTALNGTVTYNNGTLVNQTTDYYKPQCTMTLSLGSDIGPGEHKFKVLMYPDVPGGINFGDESDLTSVTLALPSASASHCSGGVNMTDNYIKDESTVICQCNLGNDGNPPGWVEWFDSSNQSVSDTKDKTALLTVTADSSGPNPDFICRGVSALGHEVSGVSFKKEIAFGPTLVNILDDKVYNQYDLCPPNPSIQLTVYCEVPVTSVNPEPTFIVSINSQTPSNEINVTNSTHYRRESVFTLTTTGRHELTCMAINSEFPAIKKQDTQAIEIRSGNVGHGSKEYVTPNEIYHSGRNSSEVVVPNEIYGKTSEVLTGTPGNAKEISTPNEIYGKGMGAKEIVVPNEIYGKGHAIEKGSQGGFRYTDYTDITPTITSATAAPVNMKKIRSKPEVALKPKSTDKPGQNSAASKDASDLVIEAGDVGGAYATVNKPFSSALPHSKAKRADTEMQQVHPDPTWKPDIPDKKFMTDEMKLSKEMAGASNDYTNKGFVEDDHDENVYQNQNEPLSRT